LPSAHRLCADRCLRLPRRGARYAGVAAARPPPALAVERSEREHEQRVRIGMIHDSGARAGRAGRMQRRFPDADVVVFGHSHEPQCELDVDGQLLLNPGSPIERRRARTHTIAVFDVHDGRIERAAIVDV
ncbi:MAG: uncharacterized protein QOK06_748, partial [Acidimicrobiaceae bacterium]